MSSSSAAAAETPQARAQRLYKSYVETNPESFGGKLQAADNLKRKIIIHPLLKKIIDVHMKGTDLDLEFVEEHIKPEDRDKVYTAIADATLVPLGGGKRKNSKNSKSRRRKSKISKRKSRKN
jgi:hypothetical protein